MTSFGNMKLGALKARAAVVVLLTLGVALPVIPYYLYQCWTEPDYSHCVLVPLIAFYVAQQKSTQRQSRNSASSFYAWAFLVACLLSYLFGVITEFTFLARISLVAIVIALFWTIMGSDAVRLYSFPLFFSFFAVPIPTTLYSTATLPMKLWTTHAAVNILDLVNTAAVAEGNIIFLSNGALEVADACSGLRSLIVLVTIAVLLAYFSRLSWVRSIFLVASSVLIALVLNITRVVCSAIMADVLGTQMISGHRHDIAGLFLVMVGVMTLLGIGQWLRGADTVMTKENPVYSSAPPGNMLHGASNRRQRIAVVLLLLTAIPANWFHWRPAPAESIPDLASFPSVIEDWRSFDTVFPESVYDALSADSNLMRTFTRDGERVAMYIGHYSSSEGGRQRHHPLACYPSAGWNILSTTLLSGNQSNGGATSAHFNQIVVERNNLAEMVRYWNQSGNTILATGLEMNTFRIQAKLKHQPYDTCFVRLSVPVVNHDFNTAERLLDQWTGRVVSILPTLPALKTGSQ